VGKDRIVVDIYLAPGTAVAPAILSALDTNGDGSISCEEGADYGHSILKSVRLIVDLFGRRFPGEKAWTSPFTSPVGSKCADCGAPRGGEAGRETRPTLLRVESRQSTAGKLLC
jgi:hypothetical protein